MSWLGRVSGSRRGMGLGLVDSMDARVGRREAWVGCEVGSSMANPAPGGSVHTLSWVAISVRLFR